jgi:platelet-activating factor acetylhydrolase
MLSFPKIVGPFKVGATTFTLPLRSSSVIGSAKLPHDKEGLRPALALEEVAFTAFYPADTSGTGSKQSRNGLDWLIRYGKRYKILV